MASLRRSKFNAKKTTCANGHVHASRREAKRCDDLHMLQRAGEISDLEIEPQFWFTINGRQIKHPNGRRVGFKPDFLYVENGQNVVEDVKGGPTMTEASALRMTFFRALFPGYDLRIVR